MCEEERLCSTATDRGCLEYTSKEGCGRDAATKILNEAMVIEMRWMRETEVDKGMLLKQLERIIRSGGMRPRMEVASRQLWSHVSTFPSLTTRRQQASDRARD